MYNETTSYINNHVMQHLADEMAMSKLIAVVTNPELSINLNSDEIKKIKEAIKAHALLNADMVLKKVEEGVLDQDDREFKLSYK